MIRPKYRKRTDINQRWYSCVVCGTAYQTIELFFEGGSTEPSVDDVLAGATSEHGGTVVKVYLLDGTWAGGDAEGIIELSSPTGIRPQTADDNPFTAFTLSENINNSTTVASNVMSCSSTMYGQGKQYGRPHPEGDIVRYRGRIFCKWHFDYRHEREWKEENTLNHIREDYTEWI